MAGAQGGASGMVEMFYFVFGCWLCGCARLLEDVQHEPRFEGAKGTGEAAARRARGSCRPRGGTEDTTEGGTEAVA